MNYLGIDYGEKRIGLSTGDDDVRLAVPVPAAVEPTREARLAHIEREIQQRRIGELVVGYPFNMDGSVGFKAKEVDAFIAELEAKLQRTRQGVFAALSAVPANAPEAKAAREAAEKEQRNAREQRARQQHP